MNVDFIKSSITYFSSAFISMVWASASPPSESLSAVMEEAETISGITRVFFLPEDHGSFEDRKRNTEFLKKHFSLERRDLVLVEDDEQKATNKLNLEQIPGIEISHYNIVGWDDHQSCEYRQDILKKINKIHETAENILSKRSQKEEDLEYLCDVMRDARSRARDEIKHLCTEDLLKSPKLENFLLSCKEYAKKVRSHIAWKEFPARQRFLQQKIHTFLKTQNEGRLFVFTGRLHVDLTNEKTASYAQALFSSLEPGSYAVITK